MFVVKNFIIFAESRILSDMFYGIKKYLICIACCLLVLACEDKDSLDYKAKAAVEQMQDVSQLATVEYTVSKVIKAEDNAWYKIGDRKILFTCEAYLKAGVDLSNFSMQSVEIDGAEKSVTITIPHAELLVINIPPDKIKNVYQKVGVLRSDFSAQERNALVKQGEQDILKDIESFGILQQADQNAVEFFTSMFRQMGFEHVTVNFYVKNEKNRL